LEKRIDENPIRICAHLSTIWELESSIVQPFWFVSLVNSTHAFVYNTGLGFIQNLVPLLWVVAAPASYLFHTTYAHDTIWFAFDMGKLYIAHHNSYHPYYWDNIECAGRDEEGAAHKKMLKCSLSLYSTRSPISL
jgi:hypothetical protein